VITHHYSLDTSKTGKPVGSLW